MPYDMCEHCDREGLTLYGWHADVWCADCIAAYAGRLELRGSVADAPVGRPEWFNDRTRSEEAYATPYILNS